MFFWKKGHGARTSQTNLFSFLNTYITHCSSSTLCLDKQEKSRTTYNRVIMAVWRSSMGVFSPKSKFVPIHSPGRLAQP